MTFEEKEILKKENEEKKAYLRSYQAEERKAKRIEERIEILREKKMYLSMTYDDMPHGMDQKDLSDYIVELEKLIDELNKVRWDALERCRQIEKDIENITVADKEKEANMKLVLGLRYIDKMEWEDIRKRMNFSLRRIYQIHGNALENIKIK